MAVQGKGILLAMHGKGLTRVATRRSWSRGVIASLIVAGPLAALAGAELGADRSTRQVVSEVSHLRLAGDYPTAIAEDRALAARAGPLDLLSRGIIDSATADSQALLIEWARSLGDHGQVDQALYVLSGVTSAELVDSARQVRSALLLEAARRDAADQDYLEALDRLNQLRYSASPAAVAAEADALRSGYDLGAAPQLVRQGRPADAVTLLDDALKRSGSPSVVQRARSMLPAALLSAGRRAVDTQSRREAQSDLLRLQYEFGSARESRAARELLQAPQPVTGTLAVRDGRPISASVRLSGRFRAVGSGYLTSPPFYLASADANGDFTFPEVPPGGPYVLEVLSGGEWTTSIDPATGRPTNSFMVEQVLPADLGFVIVSG